MSKGKVLGYVRVSSIDQNPQRQLEGVAYDKLFIDKASGKDIARPQLELLKTYARDGDTIIVHSMDRLARNLDDLRKLVQDFTAKQIQVQFIKESLTFTGTDSPMSHLLLSVMGAFAEFERSLIRERQMEGIALAKKRGVYKGRKRVLTPDQVAYIHQQLGAGVTKTFLARHFNINRQSLYNYLKRGGG